MNDTINVRGYTRRKKKLPDPFQIQIDKRLEERLAKAIEKELPRETFMGRAKAWLEMWKP